MSSREIAEARREASEAVRLAIEARREASKAKQEAEEARRETRAMWANFNDKIKEMGVAENPRARRNVENKVPEEEKKKKDLLARILFSKESHE